jgi:hypothetical protein
VLHLSSSEIFFTQGLSNVYYWDIVFLILVDIEKWGPVVNLLVILIYNTGLAISDIASRIFRFPSGWLGPKF